jgi:hypothetical protein
VRARRALVRFAPAADDGGRGDWVVCQKTVAVMAESGASLRRWQMAAVPARATCEARYRAVVNAMSQAGVRSVIIEDLITIGEEFGFNKGHEKGRLAEARSALRRVLVRRSLALSPEQEARIEATDELAQLERWHDQAVTAPSADEALSS